MINRAPLLIALNAAEEIAGYGAEYQDDQLATLTEMILKQLRAMLRAENKRGLVAVMDRAIEAELDPSDL
ncbi:MAG TPA: hypothetical protein VGO53_16515 [Steroidobacteraceae bacterium]|jgi:hypothetical protein|nr:hypothetical protein [Steroidobacteraceae bacterium]